MLQAAVSHVALDKIQIAKMVEILQVDQAIVAALPLARQIDDRPPIGPTERSPVAASLSIPRRSLSVSAMVPPRIHLRTQSPKLANGVRVGRSSVFRYERKRVLQIIWTWLDANPGAVRAIVPNVPDNKAMMGRLAAALEPPSQRHRPVDQRFNVPVLRGDPNPGFGPNRTSFVPKQLGRRPGNMPLIGQQPCRSPVVV